MDYSRCLMLSLYLISVAIRNSVLGANILAISPFASRSHYQVLRPIVTELLKQGHNVTVISPLAEDQISHDSYQPIVVNFESVTIPPSLNFHERNMFEEMEIHNFFVNLMFIWQMTLDFTELTLKTTNVRTFIENDKSNFDLVICEEFNFAPYYIFAHKYNAPLITFIPFGGAHYVNDYMRNPLNLQYVPHEFLTSFEFSNLWDRITNVVCTFGDFLLRNYYFMPKYNRLARDNFPNLLQPLPDIRAIERNISLHFTNSHFSIDTVKSYLPSIVEIGGVHEKENKQLPKDLQELMDEAKYGVIYFSFGSNILSKHLPKEKLEAFIKVFSKLDQLVLWKFEEDILPGKPANVVIRKWFPQNDVLAHPNIKLFISQCGIISYHEAIMRAVPIIGIPIYGDQHANIQKAQEMGFGIRLNYQKINLETVETTLQEVLNNPSYAQQAKKVSEIFHDKPMNALSTAIYWIEYVNRHNGAYHMKTPSSEMSWYEYYMVDVLSVFILGDILVKFSAYYFLKCIYIKIFRSRKIGKSKKQK